MKAGETLTAEQAAAEQGVSIHDAIAELLQLIERTSGVRVQAVRVEWADISTLSERRFRIRQIRTRQVSDDPEFPPDDADH